MNRQVRKQTPFTLERDEDGYYVAVHYVTSGYDVVTVPDSKEEGVQEVLRLEKEIEKGTFLWGN